MCVGWVVRCWGYAEQPDGDRVAVVRQHGLAVDKIRPFARQH